MFPKKSETQDINQPEDSGCAWVLLGPVSAELSSGLPMRAEWAW